MEEEFVKKQAGRQQKQDGDHIGDKAEYAVFSEIFQACFLFKRYNQVPASHRKAVQR